MIGIGPSIAKNPIINDPSAIGGLVLWYDFTKLDSLRQDRDGTGAVTADDDPVEWARNLANGDAGGNILGSFARSQAAGSQYGGTFKTGGAGGQPYIQFATTDSDNLHGLRSGFIAADATDDGGVASDKFSDVSIDVDNFTIIQVLKHDDAIIEESDNSLFINSYPAVGGDTNNFQYNISKEAVDEKLRSGYVVIAGGFDVESGVANDTLDTNPHVMVTRSTPGTNNMTMQVDGVIQTDTDTPDDRTMKFDRATGVTTTQGGSAFLSIGGNFSNTSSFTKSWRGGIYETLIYNKFTTDDELANLEVYLGNKYGITIS